LDESQLLIREEPKRTLNKGRLWDMVAVKEDDELGIGVFQAMVHIACFCVKIVGPG
jgi:hypothetical protein